MESQQRLAEAVRARRLAMGGLTQSEAASQAGVSDTTWNQLENGKPVSERSMAKVGQMLWGDASVPAVVLAGGDVPPQQTINLPVIEGTDWTPELLAAVRDLTEVVRELREDLRRGRR